MENHLRNLIEKCSERELIQLKTRELIEKSIKSSLKWRLQYIKRNPNYNKKDLMQYIRKKVDEDTKSLSIEIMEFTLK